jgi:hypothetical protein
LDVSWAATGSSGLFVKPIRGPAAAGLALSYNPAGTGEITYTSSSARYKTDIEGVEAPEAARVWDLRPVSFRFLADKDDQHKLYGFIAEEVAEVDPRLAVWGVDAEGRPQVEGVDYDQVVTLLLHQTKARIETYEARIETYEARIQTLEEKLDAILG